MCLQQHVLSFGSQSAYNMESAMLLSKAYAVPARQCIAQAAASRQKQPQAFEVWW
jgi:hypothetical protein